jgi:2-oxoglutarate ferredoxin oxidoreductase subunit beta
MSTLPQVNPVMPFLRTERMPHIWCPGCGIGTTVNCFARALVQSQLNLDKVALVSGIGCTGRVAGYVNLDSFHTTHGRAIPFATGLKLANPALNVVVYSGDGDLISIGGNHFIHAARRNVDITVICVNNFIYGMTGGQVAPTTPLGATATTSPYGCFEHPFNLPFLAESSGAVYVARWTAFHVRHIAHSMVEAIQKKGFSFIEILAKQRSIIKNGARTREVDINLQGEIVVGKFVDIERPTLQQSMDQQLRQTLHDQYAGAGGAR